MSNPWIAICGPVRQPAADQRDCRLWPPLQGKAQWIKLIRCLFETCPGRDSLSGRQLERPSGLCSECFSDCYITHECSEWMPRVLTLLWSLGASVRGPSDWRRFLCPPRAEKRNCWKCSMRCWFQPQPTEGWEGNRTATSAAPPPHPPPRCRFFLLFFVCFACFSFLVLLAGFSFLVLLTVQGSGD